MVQNARNAKYNTRVNGLAEGRQRRSTGATGGAGGIGCAGPCAWTGLA